jgi:enoyl-CoA hydratase
MTPSDTSDDRVLFGIDSAHRIATITLNNPSQRNSYDASMRDRLARYLDIVAEDDDVTVVVVVLRGAEGVLTTGADMNNAYAWYGDKPDAADAPRPRRDPVSVVDSPWTASHSGSITT